ncbi:MAG: FAD-binding oxidoreductase [Rhodospirillales bacterium]|nr:FAD-binding oxidoreductase [Rhodospirillales bacterium]
MARTWDAIVIGAGIIGASVARELAAKGYRALSVDRLPAASYGSTSNSCAIIRPYYSTVHGSAIAYEGHFYWKDWDAFCGVTDELGMASYNNCGCMITKTEHNGFLKGILEIMDEIGCPYEELTAEEMRERVPPMATDAYDNPRTTDDPLFGQPTGQQVVGAACFPCGGYISDPQLAGHNVQRAAEARGATFRFNTTVTAIRQEGGRVIGVTLDDGEELDAPIVVNVAGPHSSKINEMAGLTGTMRITTRALRHEVAHVPAPEGFDIEKQGYVFSDSQIGAYSRPETGNHMLIGSEDPACDEKEWVDPDDYLTEFTGMWTTLVMRQAQRFPELRIPNTAKGAVDLYDVTEDWGPIYDKSDLGGFYLAIGTSGNQFKNAPIAGEMMADLIEACENGRDHDTDPVSYRLRNIDRTVDMAFFSRNRAINENSSFSVLG